MALITRSGTNDLHGSAYFFFRPTATSANDWFNKYTEDQLGEPNKPARLDRKTFGGAIGGPIKKDKLFYFFNYEGQRTSEQITVTRTVPSDTLRQGIIQYACNPSADPNCSTGNANVTVSQNPAFVPLLVATLTPQQFAFMDPNCFGIGTCQVPGANPAVLQVFKQYPHANGTITGDGLNFGSYTFASPVPASLNTLIGKVDYNITQNQHLFVRGGLMDDSTQAAEQFPGQTAASSSRINTKGIAVGHTWTVRVNLINNFRYGYTRPSVSTIGIATQPIVGFGGLDYLDPPAYNQKSQIAVNNFVDDLTWVKGKNTFQFGGNVRLIHNDFQGTTLSYNNGFTNAFYLAPGRIANSGSSLDPGAFQFPAVDSSYGSTYDNAAAALAGLVSQVTANYNYQFQQNSNQMSLFNQGAYVPRKYYSFETEYYLQDTIRLRPSLTMTLGLRQSLLQPPYEANGQQISPTMSLHDWYLGRAAAAANGQSYSPTLEFNRSGQANGKAPYWAWDYADIAPRFALAWTPSAEQGLLSAVFGAKGQTTVRMGYGIYYDHFGQGVVQSFNRYGAFGLTTSITNASGVQTVDGVPRFTGLNDIPPSLVGTAPPPVYPFVPDSSGPSSFQITWGLDDKLKTPYSHAFDFSWSRELKGDFILEVSSFSRLSTTGRIYLPAPPARRIPNYGTTLAPAPFRGAP